MIDSKNSLRLYLMQDAKALRIDKRNFKRQLIDLFFPNYILRFQRLLRKTEYYHNTSSRLLNRLAYFYFYYKFKRLSVRLGFSIPLNVFGPGLAIIHYGTIVVNSNAKVGANCRIHPSTCIGASGGTSLAPVIGNNVYIGPGAKIYGDIKLANNIAIAANAAVGSSFSEENILIGGVPATKIKDFNIKSVIRHI